jgi:hypothetical protein
LPRKFLAEGTEGGSWAIGTERSHEHFPGTSCRGHGLSNILNSCNSPNTGIQKKSDKKFIYSWKKEKI